jgi:very-short-patch-repair endonuclease
MYVADFFVDFFLPETQTIIEIEGPSHFIAPSKQRNVTTEARYRILRKKGYNLILIPFYINELSKEADAPRLEDLLAPLDNC